MAFTGSAWPDPSPRSPGTAHEAGGAAAPQPEGSGTLDAGRPGPRCLFPECTWQQYPVPPTRGKGRKEALQPQERSGEWGFHAEHTEQSLQVQMQEERLGLKWAQELVLQELLSRGSPGKASEGVWAHGCRGHGQANLPPLHLRSLTDACFLPSTHGRCRPRPQPSGAGTSTHEETPAQEVQELPLRSLT